FFNDTAPTEIDTLSLHDALPIYPCGPEAGYSGRETMAEFRRATGIPTATKDRKSTRLNSSHPSISYAVFFFKKTARFPGPPIPPESPPGLVGGLCVAPGG